MLKKTNGKTSNIVKCFYFLQENLAPQEKKARKVPQVLRARMAVQVRQEIRENQDNLGKMERQESKVIKGMMEFRGMLDLKVILENLEYKDPPGKMALMEHKEREGKKVSLKKSLG
jgi:hypothetical protein